ncbi:helix-turn-helix transcriptional regulator [Kribbella pittospori]|uniref:Helix-turn-helix transcriptional regulator n=1 Tax=Kribbella pittospori TaxID=722689 RepID=A0A4R0L5Y9_9ACTN|nr:AAA family ATPase [Kribbella pittospori]TCC66328.1 helix-turn-helix transcriptional regulator [Kribbella pittospori]
MGGLRADHRFAGRAVEQELLGDVVRDAVGGIPRAIVIHGEAGIGKSRLAREVCRDPRLTVLWGSCVHFGGASVPFAPISGALQDWLSQADADERERILAGTDGLTALLPSIGTGGGAADGVDSTRLPMLVDLVLNRIADQRPTVVVIDDLQWADVASLDVLSYLIAGFRAQRLVLIATCRTEERGEGHPLHSWLADMRRMPYFGEISLQPLDLDAVSNQIEGLLGRTPDIELATEVLARSDGNPYLVELMVRGLSGSERSLPSTVPVALGEALLATWHGLSEQARLVTRVLAVGGRPTSYAVLTEVASGHGIKANQITPSLSEAQDRGVVWNEGGDWWFRHPLLAEVLYDGLSPDQAIELHSGYVRVLESRPTELTAADLAVHNERAGTIDATFRWSLVAADQAAQLRAPSEEAIQLRRACALWESASPAVRGGRDDRIRLLRRTSTICVRASVADAAFPLLTEALSLVDKEREPLLACDLLVARSAARWQSTSPGMPDLADVLEAIELTTDFPASPERAIAFAELSEDETLHGLPDDVLHAEESVRIARRSGSTQALGRALVALAAVTDSRAPLKSLADAEIAERLARSCGDVDTATNAAIFRFNALHTIGPRSDAAEVTRAAYLDAVSAGAGVWAYFLAFQAAGELIDLGRWDECRALLRSALAARAADIPGAGVRLSASLLAARTGRTEEARQHFDRALELISDDFNPLRPYITRVGIELMTAEGRVADSVAWARPRLTALDQAPDAWDDEVLPGFAQAAANAACAARDRGDVAAAAAAADAIDSVIDGWPRAPFAHAMGGVDVQTMNEALLAAEIGGSRNTPDQPELWRRAADTCGVAGSRWEQAVAQWRCAEAELTSGPTSVQARDLLRQAHTCAVELGAEPLRRAVESLARRAKVDLSTPVPVEREDDDPRLAALTDREREVLAFLVAGRSNSEIAKDLFISDKTVSVHVSNILRKTGTTSRVAAAALAERRLPGQ